jgi:hypothetical protein
MTSITRHDRPIYKTRSDQGVLPPSLALPPMSPPLPLDPPPFPKRLELMPSFSASPTRAIRPAKRSSVVVSNGRIGPRSGTSANGARPRFSSASTNELVVNTRSITMSILRNRLTRLIQVGHADTAWSLREGQRNVSSPLTHDSRKKGLASLSMPAPYGLLRPTVRVPNRAANSS